jgi:hypothetical protein
MVFLISALENYFSFLDKIEVNALFYGLLSFTWIVSVWEHYLSYRQVYLFVFVFLNLKLFDEISLVL